MLNRVLCFVFLLTGLLSCNSDSERKITAPEVPQAVLQAFHNAYPNAEVSGYAEEREGGEKIYEVSFKKDGQRFDVSYFADGRVREVEETIAPADLPPAVQEAIKNKFPEAQIKLAEKVVKDGQVAYEAKVDVQENGAAKRYELVFDADGKLRKQESEEEGEE